MESVENGRLQEDDSALPRGLGKPRRTNGTQTRFVHVGVAGLITMYSADGDHILITHYCSTGNQPQMKTETMSGSAEKYTFTLVRVTGMKTQDEGHMVGLVLSFPDKDHLMQEWKYQNNKGKTSADLFQFKRKPEKADDRAVRKLSKTAN